MKSKRCQRSAVALIGATIFVTALSAQAPDSAAKKDVFQLPGSIAAGTSKEFTVLIDESHLKLTTITLRSGTALPVHSAPVPTTVQVLEGNGVIHVGSKTVPVSKGTIVLIAAGEAHDVVPSPGSDMLLLVHYLQSAPAAAATGAHDH